MKILHVGKYYPPYMGGTEIYTQDLVRHQSPHAEVEVIVSNNRNTTQIDQMDGAKVTRIARLALIASMPVNVSMPDRIRKSSADIVHMHMPNPAAAFSYLTSGNRGKVILTHHADTVGRKFLRMLSDPVVRKVMDKASRIIVTTQRYLDTSTELADFRDKCVVIPLGVNTDRFSQVSQADVESIRKTYKRPLLVCIGRLVSFKGYQYAIEALKGVEADLLIAGDGPMKEELQKLAADFGVADKVHFLGSLPNDRIPALLKASSIVLFPSIRRTESFGYVQLEAMASGVPVINTAIDSAAAEVSMDGVTGFTVEPMNGPALSEAIQKLLADNALRERFGAAGVERVRDNFTLDGMARKTMALYREVL